MTKNRSSSITSPTTASRSSPPTQSKIIKATRLKATESAQLTTILGGIKTTPVPKRLNTLIGFRVSLGVSIGFPIIHVTKPRMLTTKDTPITKAPVITSTPPIVVPVQRISENTTNTNEKQDFFVNEFRSGEVFKYFKSLQPSSFQNDEGSCSDGHVSCNFWSDRNECNLNPNYMLRVCKRACRVC